MIIDVAEAIRPRGRYFRAVLALMLLGLPLMRDRTANLSFDLFLLASVKEGIHSWVEIMLGYNCEVVSSMI